MPGANGGRVGMPAKSKLNSRQQALERRRQSTDLRRMSIDPRRQSMDWRRQSIQSCDSDWQSAPVSPEAAANGSPFKRNKPSSGLSSADAATSSSVVVQSPPLCESTAHNVNDAHFTALETANMELRGIVESREGSSSKPRLTQPHRTPERLAIPAHVRRETSLDDSPHWSPKPDGKQKMLHHFRRIVSLLPTLRSAAISFCETVVSRRKPQTDTLFSVLSKWASKTHIQKHTEALNSLFDMLGKLTHCADKPTEEEHAEKALPLLLPIEEYTDVVNHYVHKLSKLFKQEAQELAEIEKIARKLRKLSKSNGEGSGVTEGGKTRSRLTSLMDSPRTMFGTSGSPAVRRESHNSKCTSANELHRRRSQTDSKLVATREAVLEAGAKIVEGFRRLVIDIITEAVKLQRQQAALQLQQCDELLRVLKEHEDAEAAVVLDVIDASKQ